MLLQNNHLLTRSPGEWKDNSIDVLNNVAVHFKKSFEGELQPPNGANRT